MLISQITRIQEKMSESNWAWMDGIPSADDIYNNIQYLKNNAQKQHNVFDSNAKNEYFITSVSTGGLTVHFDGTYFYYIHSAPEAEIDLTSKTKIEDIDDMFYDSYISANYKEFEVSCKDVRSALKLVHHEIDKYLINDLPKQDSIVMHRIGDTDLFVVIVIRVPLTKSGSSDVVYVSIDIADEVHKSA